jgi:hypothetical protein
VTASEAPSLHTDLCCDGATDGGIQVMTYQYRTEEEGRTVTLMMTSSRRCALLPARAESSCASLPAVLGATLGRSCDVVCAPPSRSLSGLASDAGVIQRSAEFKQPELSLCYAEVVEQIKSVISNEVPITGQMLGSLAVWYGIEHFGGPYTLLHCGRTVGLPDDSF